MLDDIFIFFSVQTLLVLDKVHTNKVFIFLKSYYALCSQNNQIGLAIKQDLGDNINIKTNSKRITNTINNNTENNKKSKSSAITIMATQVQPQNVEDISVDFADIKQSKENISDDSGKPNSGKSNNSGKSKKSKKASRDPSPEKPKSSGTAGSDLKRKTQQRATKSDPKNENPKPTKKSRDPSPPKKAPKETPEGIVN